MMGGGAPTGLTAWTRVHRPVKLETLSVGCCRQCDELLQSMYNSISARSPSVPFGPVSKAKILINLWWGKALQQH